MILINQFKVKPEESNQLIAAWSHDALLTSEFDLASCWQAANPDRPLAQTLRWMGNPGAPYHCDGIFVPRSWLPRLKSCRVVRGSRWSQLSDHNPVVADFQAANLESGGLPPL